MGYDQMVTWAVKTVFENGDVFVVILSGTVGYILRTIWAIRKYSSEDTHAVAHPQEPNPLWN